MAALPEFMPTDEEIAEERALIEAELVRRQEAAGGSGFDGTAYFSDIGTATGRALHGGDIAFDKERYAEMSGEERLFTIIHEMAHQTVEPYVLANNDEWDLAEAVLTVAELRGGRRLFAGGNMVIGEAVSDAVASQLTNLRFGNISDEKWAEIVRWAKEVTKRAGYSSARLQEDAARMKDDLDSQL